MSWQRQGEEILLRVACPESVACSIRLDGEYSFAENGSRYAESGAGEYRIQAGAAERPDA